MNKQKIIEKLEKSLTYCAADYDSGYDDGIGDAIALVKQLDEPEKPVLTKDEAEWVDHLTEFFDTPDALYYITRCDYSECPFTFDFWGDTYELPIEEGIEYGEFNKIRERLVNAVVYGYEVEKDKFYTAKLKLTGEYLHYDEGYNKVHHTFADDYTVKKLKTYHFTKDTLLKYSAWENDFYSVIEVKE